MDSDKRSQTLVGTELRIDALTHSYTNALTHAYTHSHTLDPAHSAHSDMAASHQSPKDVGWLPSRHEPPLLDGPLSHKYIKERKSSDWFLTLHDAMPRKYEARMMAKMYLFLRQYMPEGLTGRWAHLRGNKIMRVLLSDREEQCVSRHKATKKIYPSLEKLETWMAKGGIWRVVWENSKVEARKMKPHTAKRKQHERAPSPLYSPERCLAFLILAYPDRKYRDKFQRLQLGWMIDDPAALNVQDNGFWRGLDSHAVSSLFSPEKALQTNDVEDRSLDYDVLFGAAFPQCREDIRPYLPLEEWAKGLRLAPGDPNEIVVDFGEANAGDADANDTDGTSSDLGDEEAEAPGSVGLSSTASPISTITGKDALSGDNKNRAFTATYDTNSSQ